MRTAENLTKLGSTHTEYKRDYNPGLLESFENKHPGNDYFVNANCPEFTSLCPITGQSDFANIVISYVPDMKLVESKSLKLYLFSFCDHGDFHEDVVNKIMKDLYQGDVGAHLSADEEGEAVRERKVWERVWRGPDSFLLGNENARENRHHKIDGL